MIEFSVIASGSKGNATIIKINKTLILIDIGISRTKLKNEMKELNLNIEDINLVLITHTHTDHVKGLEQLLKHHNPILYIGKTMVDEILIKHDKIKYIKQKYEINDITIESIKTSHDKEESYGFVITYKDNSLVYITDTGYIPNKSLSKIKNKTAYIIESNHDVEKLMDTERPYFLKQRIISDEGHLSNIDCCYYLNKSIGNNTEIVILAHLSEAGNSEELARQTFTDNVINKDIKLKIAKQETKTKLLKITKKVI